jgi:hypothetical protein
MARFKNKDIFFKDYDKAIFGSDQDSTLFWDGTEEDLRLTTVISGVYPTEDGHLTTKYYVDQGDIDNFLELTDTPTLYSGSSLKFVRVNEDESGLHFENAIVGVTSSGTTPPDDSNLWYNTTYNEFFYYDPVRDNWLSLTVHNYLFTRQSNVDGLYLSVGDLRHAGAHYPIPRPATITAVISAAENIFNSSKGFDIRSNGSTVFSFNHTNWEYANMAADIDLNEDTNLRVFCTSAGDRCRNPSVLLEIRWRYVE